MVREGTHVVVKAIPHPTLTRWMGRSKDLLQTTQPANVDNAYNINLDNGQVNNDNKNNDNNNRARCVREHTFTFDELYNAYIACRKNKRNTINALQFEKDLECNLEWLVYELNTRSYRAVRSVCFTILKPKPREIFAADFQDRIVHHVLFNHLNPIYEKKFIYASFACRKKKGTLAAVKYTQQLARKITQTGQKRAYYLQLDVHNFFMSINKDILRKIVLKHISDNSLKWLAQNIISHDPTEKFIQKSTVYLQSQVPNHKSLLSRPKNRGLPIGNLTSQFFANVYLNELDQFVKHTLKVKHYVRYVDDLVLLNTSKIKLVEQKRQIERYLEEQLKMRLKPTTKIQPISNGINFVGYIIRPQYLLPRNRNIHSIHQSIKHTHEKSLTQFDEFKLYHYLPIAELSRKLASYFGHLTHANSHKILIRLFENYPFLDLFFSVENGMLRNKWKNEKTTLIKNSLICFQVGNMYRISCSLTPLVSKLCETNLYSTKVSVYTDVSKRTLFHNLDVILRNVSICTFMKQNQDGINFSHKLDYVVVSNLLLES